MAQESNKNGSRKLREETSRSLNGLAKELELQPVAIRANNAELADFFKNLLRNVSAERMDNLSNLCDEWEHHWGEVNGPTALMHLRQSTLIERLPKSSGHRMARRSRG